MNKKKSIAFFLSMAACLSLGLGSIHTKAYTDEEKAYVKSMLQAYGFSPDMAGANQAFQDYLSGKYNDICLLGIDTAAPGSNDRRLDGILYPDFF